jgi:DNA-binding transcriptional MerR regulator
MPDNETEVIEEDAYTLPELAELTGVDPRTLHNWMHRDILSPSRQRAKGSGTRNLFDRRDALFLVMVAELRHGGAEMPALEGIASELRDFASSSTGEELLMINGAVKAVDNTEELTADLDHSGPAFVYATSRAHRMVSEFAARASRAV